MIPTFLSLANIFVCILYVIGELITNISGDNANFLFIWYGFIQNPVNEYEVNGVVWVPLSNSPNTDKLYPIVPYFAVGKMWVYPTIVI